MRVITIGSDRKLFEEGSAVRARITTQAELFDELHIIVFSLRSNGFKKVHVGNLHLHPTNSLSRLLYVFDAGRIARRLPGDVLTTQDPFEAGLAGMFGRKGRPLQVQLHTDPFSSSFVQVSFLNRIRRIIAAYVLPRAQGIRVTSNSLKQELEMQYPKLAQIVVLPVFIDVSKFTHLQRAVNHGASRTLLWVGRFEREKNPALALEALAYVRNQGIEVTLCMLGAGREYMKLQARARELQVEASVEFPGWKDPVDYLKYADIALCTSDYEGYGMSIVEALAARVPVLSTNVGIAREAGAMIASKEEFPHRLAELCGKPLPAAKLLLPQMKEAEYRKVYQDSLTQLCI